MLALGLNLVRTWVVDWIATTQQKDWAHYAIRGKEWPTHRSGPRGLAGMGIGVEPTHRIDSLGGIAMMLLIGLAPSRWPRRGHHQPGAGMATSYVEVGV